MFRLVKVGTNHRRDVYLPLGMLLVHAAVKPNRCLNPRETDALLSAPLPFLQKLSRLQTLPDNNEQVVTGVLKYVPQVLLNIRRRSTKGWTIWNVILDLTGGLLSVVQVFIFTFIKTRQYCGI